MSVYRLGLALGASCLLAGCLAAAPKLTAAEQETRNELSSSKYQPAPRELRDNIGTQQVLAQAAFWSHEYNLNPSDLESAIKFSAVLRKMGNPGRAVEVTRTTRALYPRDPYLNAEHAAGLIANQQVRPALKIIDSTLKDAPAYGRLWSLKGVALDQMEKYAEARPFYNRALQITPNDPNVMANLGLNYALSGDPHTARQWLSRAASNPNASDSVHANLELVESLAAQAGPAVQNPHAAPRYQPQPAPPRNYAPQRTSRASSAPQTYGSYQPAPATSRPQYAPPAQPRAQYQYQQPSYQGQVQSTQAVPQHSPTYSQYSQRAPQPETVATSDDVLSRIAKNVGPKSTAPSLPDYAAAYEGRPEPRQNTQAATPYPQQNASSAPNYGQAPELRGGYPAPQVPYYTNPSSQEAPQRRPAARRRG